MNDINLGKVAWTPIGAGSRSFRGVFEGNNYTISGLYINTSSSNVGLFGNVEGGTVQNLRIADSSITGGQHVGALCAYNGNGLIQNCHIESTVSVRATVHNNSGGGCYVGGVVRSCRKYRL